MAAQHHVRPDRWLAFARRGRSTWALGRPVTCAATMTTRPMHLLRVRNNTVDRRTVYWEPIVGR